MKVRVASMIRRDHRLVTLKVPAYTSNKTTPCFGNFAPFAPLRVSLLCLGTYHHQGYAIPVSGQVPSSPSRARSIRAGILHAEDLKSVRDVMYVSPHFGFCSHSGVSLELLWRLKAE